MLKRHGAHQPMTPSHLKSLSRKQRHMPSHHGGEIPNDGQMFVAIDVVKSSAMNKPEKRPVQAHI